jgi:hypothetical protein
MSIVPASCRFNDCDRLSLPGLERGGSDWRLWADGRRPWVGGTG